MLKNIVRPFCTSQNKFLPLTWVSVNSRSWWWTGRPGVLRFMGSQRVGHDWATDLIWSEVVKISELEPHTTWTLEYNVKWKKQNGYLGSLTNSCEKKRSDQISYSVVSNSFWPHESQHTRPPCPSPTPGVHWDSRPSSQVYNKVIQLFTHTHTHTHTYIYIYILFQAQFPYRLLQNIEYISLCYTVGPCWLSIL